MWTDWFNDYRNRRESKGIRLRPLKCTWSPLRICSIIIIPPHWQSIFLQPPPLFYTLSATTSPPASIPLRRISHTPPPRDKWRLLDWSTNWLTTRLIERLTDISWVFAHLVHLDTVHWTCVGIGPHCVTQKRYSLFFQGLKKLLEN